MTLTSLNSKCGADKPPLYLEFYDKYFKKLRDNPLKLLELGIYKGGSLRLWQAYFPNALVGGLDIEAFSFPSPEPRIKTFKGSQADTGLLDRIGAEMAPEKFDIIIDDASHVGSLSKISFWHLFTHHLKKGGLYVIEDWRVGYWDQFPEGAVYSFDTHFSPEGEFSSHRHGLVGFIKQLVDELGMDMITLPERGHKGKQKNPVFKSIEITPGQCFITKR